MSVIFRLWTTTWLISLMTMKVIVIECWRHLQTQLWLCLLSRSALKFSEITLQLQVSKFKVKGGHETKFHRSFSLTQFRNELAMTVPCGRFPWLYTGSSHFSTLRVVDNNSTSRRPLQLLRSPAWKCSALAKVHVNFAPSRDHEKTWDTTWYQGNRCTVNGVRITWEIPFKARLKDDKQFFNSSSSPDFSFYSKQGWPSSERVGGLQ